MKLSDWARKNNLSYPTAHSLFKKGQLPVKATQLATGTILIEEEADLPELKTFIYSRVSSNNKKDDLNRQAERCVEFCKTKGWIVEKVVKEIGSGMNDNRQKLMKLFDGTPKRIVVEHKDRLTRFGFNYFDTLLKQLNYELIVINRDEQAQDDLMKDLVSVMTSFCCRLYGLRKGRNNLTKIKSFVSEL